MSGPAGELPGSPPRRTVSEPPPIPRWPGAPSLAYPMALAQLDQARLAEQRRDILRQRALDTFVQPYPRGVSPMESTPDDMTDGQPEDYAIVGPGNGNVHPGVWIAADWDSSAHMNTAAFGTELEALRYAHRNHVAWVGWVRFGESLGDAWQREREEAKPAKAEAQGLAPLDLGPLLADYDLTQTIDLRHVLGQLLEYHLDSAPSALLLGQLLDVAEAAAQEAPDDSAPDLRATLDNLDLEP